MTDELPGAGPELDALVAKALRIDGYDLAKYSTMDCLEFFLEGNPSFTGRVSLPRRNWCRGREWQAQLWRQGDFRETCVMGRGETPYLAICHAIIRATGEVQSGSSRELLQLEQEGLL